MLVVFLLDTSASMNQRCANGLSLLDCAKSAIEHFHKVCDSWSWVACTRFKNVVGSETVKFSMRFCDRIGQLILGVDLGW